MLSRDTVERCIEELEIAVENDPIANKDDLPQWVCVDEYELGHVWMTMRQSHLIIFKPDEGEVIMGRSAPGLRAEGVGVTWVGDDETAAKFGIVFLATPETGFDFLAGLDDSSMFELELDDFSGESYGAV